MPHTSVRGWNAANYFFRGDWNRRKTSATPNTAKNPNTPKIEYERMGRGAALLTANT